MGRGVLTTCVCLLVASLWTPTVSVAQSASDPNGEPSDAPEWGERDDEARALFEAARIAYRDGHFADAEASFRRSYELSGRPELLHNVAVAAERANHDREALDAYREFLQRVPDSPMRPRVEVRIAALEEIGAGGGGDPGPWIVLGAGLAVAVAGAIMVGVAAADVAAVEGAPFESRWETVAEAYDRSGPLSIAGAVAIGVGVVTAGLGLTWGLVASGESQSARLELRMGLGSLALRGGW